MFGPTFLDEINTGNCGDLFDNIEDLLDFPMEDVAGDGGGDFDDFQGLWSPPPPPQPDALVASNPVFPNNNNNDDNTKNTIPPEIPTCLSFPYEEFPSLDWLSNFMESFPAGSMILNNDTTTTTTTTTTAAATTDNKNDILNSNHNNSNNDFHQFKSSSPVSVLESSSSYSGGKTMPLNAETFVRGRARSKRSRPTAFNRRSAIQLMSPSSSVTDNASSELVSEIGNHAESRLMTKIPEPNSPSEKKKKKKTKRRKLGPLLSRPSDYETASSNTAVRKCLHCEITKTPQWRAGPLGPKTLCNACGVRYKSGRLYPEYRPAASPTFVPALHSNSHKKVLEMRIRSCEKLQNPEFIQMSQAFA